MAITPTKNIVNTQALTAMTSHVADFGKRYFWIILPTAIVATILLTRYCVKPSLPTTPPNVQALQKNIDGLKAQITTLKKDLEDAKKEPSQLKQDIATKEKALNALETAKKQAEEKLATAETAKTDTETKLVGSETAKTKAEQDLAEAQANLATMTTDRDAKETARVAAETAKTKAEQDLAEAQANLATMTTDRDAKETARVAAETAKTKAEQDLAEAQANLEAMTTDRNTKEEARVEAEAAKTKAEEDLAAAQADLETMTTDRNTKEEARVEAEAAKTKAEQDLAEAQANLETMATDRDAKETARVAAETAKTKAEEDLAAAQADLETMTTDRNTKEEARVAAETAKTKAEEDLAAAQADLETMTTDRDTKETSREKAVSDMQAMQRNLEEAEEKKEDLEKQIAKLENEKTEIEQKVTQEIEQLKQNEPLEKTTKKIEELNIKNQELQEAKQLADDAKNKAQSKLEELQKSSKEIQENLKRSLEAAKKELDEKAGALTRALAHVDTLVAQLEFKEGKTVWETAERFAELLAAQYKQQLETIRTISIPKLEASKTGIDSESVQKEAIDIWNKQNPSLQIQDTSMNMMESISVNDGSEVNPQDTSGTTYAVTDLLRKVVIQTLIIELIDEKTAKRFTDKKRFTNRLVEHPSKRQKYQEAVEGYAAVLKDEYKHDLNDLLKGLPDTAGFNRNIRRVIMLLLGTDTQVVDNRQRYQQLNSAIETVIQDIQWTNGKSLSQNYRDLIEDLIYVRWNGLPYWHYVQSLPQTFRELSGDYQPADSDFQDKGYQRWVYNANLTVNSAPQNQFIRKPKLQKMGQMWEGNVGTRFIDMNVPHKLSTLTFEKDGSEHFVCDNRYASVTTAGSNVVAIGRMLAAGIDIATWGNTNTQDYFAGGNGECVLPEYEEFLRICEKREMGVLLTSHQTLVAREHMKGQVKTEDESGRVNSIMNLENKHPNYFCLVQPFYGPLFDKYGDYEGIKKFKAFKKAVVNAFTSESKEKTGCALPKIIRSSDENENSTTEYRKTLEILFDDVHSIFFENKETIELPNWMAGKETPFNGANGLTKEDKQKIAWQTFLVYFYIFQQMDMQFRLKDLQQNLGGKVYPIKHRVAQCKDAQDRAGLFNFLKGRLFDTILNRELDHEKMKQKADAFIGVCIANKKQGINHWINLALRGDALRQHMPAVNKERLKNYAFNGYKLKSDDWATGARDGVVHSIQNAQYPAEYLSHVHLEHDENFNRIVDESNRELNWHEVEGVQLSQNVPLLSEQCQFNCGNEILIESLGKFKEKANKRDQNAGQIIDQVQKAKQHYQGFVSEHFKNDQLGLKVEFPADFEKMDFDTEDFKGRCVMSCPFVVKTKDETELVKGSFLVSLTLNSSCWEWSYKIDPPAKSWLGLF